MTIVARSIKAAIAAALFGAAALPVSAAEYQFDWGFKWSIGSINHTTDVVDSDPSATRAVYENAILDYRFDAFEFFDYYLFEGRGGTLIVDAQTNPGALGCEPSPTLACVGKTFTFVLGQARASLGDLANYTLVATLPWRSPWENPARPLDTEWVDAVSGMIYSDTGTLSLGAMDPNFSTSHLAVAGPVPEPATMALFAVGATVMGWGARRRTRVEPTGPTAA